MKITLKGKENVYEQIVNEYKRLIKLNIIRYDEKLPSCRQLALELGINPNTVSRAYNVLEKEGYIKAIPKKGVYVVYQNNENINKIQNEVYQYLKNIKNNLTYEEIINMINIIYKGENHD